MNFNDVIMMRECGGAFAGSLFLGLWFLTKTWMFWIGLIIGLILKEKNGK